MLDENIGRACLNKSLYSSEMPIAKAEREPLDLDALLFLTMTHFGFLHKREPLLLKMICISFSVFLCIRWSSFEKQYRQVCEVKYSSVMRTFVYFP
jgi:hypothetical protein